MHVEISRRWLLAGSLVLLPPPDVLAAPPSQAMANESDWFGGLGPPPAPDFGVQDAALREVRDCLKQNIPKYSSSQTLRFVSTDRIGQERECEAKVLGTMPADGLRRLKVCMVKPADVRGMKLLSIEVPGAAPDTYLYSTEKLKVIHLSGEGLGGSVCGSDVSYEDLNRQQQLNHADKLERLADADLGGRTVYVLLARPTDAAHSAYTKVLSYVDKKTCVVIKTESFEAGEKPRKVMTAELDNLLEEDGIRVPAEMVVTDLRDQTHTTVTADDLEIDNAVDKRSFEVSRLDGKRCR
jgi:hypothetical protein